MAGTANKIKQPAVPRQNNPGPLPAYKLHLTLAFIALLVLIAGYFIYSAQAKSLRSKVDRELSAIAQLKAAEIARWRTERLAYADSVTERPFFPVWVAEWIASPTPQMETALRERLTAEAKLSGYPDILIADTSGKVVMRLNNSARYPDSITLEQTGMSFKERKALMTDIYFSPENNKPHIDIIAPLFLHQGDSEQAIGSIVFCIDPAQFLYPLIEAWPLPSRTAEIQLVEKDDGSVVFLNYLNFQPDAALKMRTSLTDRESVAVMAVTGGEGIVEGTDYRGEHVLAALQKVQGSPWTLVAKIDTDEALADWQWQSGMIIAVFITSLAAAWAVIGLFWQRRQRFAYQALYKAEMELSESEAKYKNIIEHSGDMFYMFDLKGKPLYLSPGAIGMLGYTVDEFFQIKWTDHLADSPVNRAAIASTVAALTTGKKQPPYPIEFRRKDGEKLSAEINESPLKDHTGKVTGLVGTMRDITGRRKAEQALQKSEERFSAAFSMNPDPTAITASETGQFVDVNPAYEKWSGFSREELIDKTSRELNFWVNPADRDAFLDRLRNHEAVEDMEITFRVRSGELRNTWFTARTSILGGREHLLTRAHDVTERNRMLEAVHDSEEKYRSVVENSMEAIVIAENGVIQFGNRQASVLTGYAQEEYLSRPFIAFIHADDRHMVVGRYFQQIKNMGVSDIIAFRFICKSGDIKWVEVSMTPIIWEGRKATLNFMHDITDRKRLEKEQQRVARLESVGLLAGGIAHDFNNILTAILGNISLANMEAAPGSELRNSLEQAEKASLRAKDLTKQLLTFSRGGAPVMKLSSLTELLKDTSDFALHGSNVKCNFSIPADLRHAEIDAGQVSQVIHNLVINAQQAMPEGGTIEIIAENMDLSGTQMTGRGLPLKAGAYIRIAVVDHGTGIPADHLENIFDPFFSTKQRGSGLGLATSFSIARQHGGHIGVESAPGAGSTFYVYLPASTTTAAPDEQQKEVKEPAGKARILVMDDEKGVREVAGRMLISIGYKDIEYAKDGAEAIKLYKGAMESGNPFTVAILDLTIAGGMGGKETVRKLLKIDPVVKAIVSSGYADDPVIARYKEYGFSGMVAKPYTIEELGKALQDVIGAA